MNDIVVDIEYLTVAMGDQAYEFIEVMRIVEDIIEFECKNNNLVPQTEKPDEIFSKIEVSTSSFVFVKKNMFVNILNKKYCEQFFIYNSHLFWYFNTPV